MANENEECLTLITISYHYTTILTYLLLPRLEKHDHTHLILDAERKQVFKKKKKIEAQ